MSINKKLLLILMLLLVLIVGSAQLIKRSNKYQTQEVQKNNATASQANNTGLPYTYLNNIIAQSGAACSVYYKSLSGNEVFYNYSGKMPAAGIERVFILAQALEEVEKGSLKLEETYTLEKNQIAPHSPALKDERAGAKIPLATLLEKMVTVNDDTAANMVIDILGREEINAFLQKHGYVDTSLPFEEEKANDKLDNDNKVYDAAAVTSVNDLVNFYAQVYQKKCVSPQVDAQVLTILKLQRDNSKLKALLPKGTAVAHQSGDLSGVQNDGGIVYSKDPYVLVIMTDKSVHQGQTLKTINQISSVIYNSVADKEVFKK